MNRRIVLLLCAAALAGSCSRSTSVVAPSPPVVPQGAYSPAEAVRLLEWAWNNRSCEALRRVLTADFRFAFALGDSAGNDYREAPWTLTDELLASDSCFRSAPGILVDFDRSLIALPDDRPGRHPRWHKTVTTGVYLKATLNSESGPRLYVVGGSARFYVVRGDSAALTPEAIAAGGRDSTRWWIDRWEDGTLPAGGASVHPSGIATWGWIKRRFH